MVVMTRSKTNWQDWLEAAAALVYPGICQICRDQRSDAREGFVCTNCRSQVQTVRPPFCSRCGLPHDGDITSNYECGNCLNQAFDFRYARAAVINKSVVQEALRRFKYSGAVWFEPFLVELLVNESISMLNPKDWDVIVPVPLHPVKQRTRGFNQAEILGRGLSQASGIKINTTLLARHLPTPTQTTLARAARLQNMHGAFRVKKGKRLDKQRVVLVDDIFTTGATTNACAKALKAAGSAEVCVWTVARGL